MKRTLLTFAALLAVISISAQSSRTVTIEEAGTLQALLGDDYMKVESLTVKGPINSTDLRTIRYMAGNSYEEDNDKNGVTGEGALSYLDMSDADIVEGGEPYLHNKWYTDRNDHNCYTKKNSLDYAAFRRCNNLKTVILPKSLTNIGRKVFECNSGVEKIVVGDNVTTIGKQTFNECTNLKEINLPASLKSIDEQAFKLCSELISISIPDKVGYIGAYTFEKCTGLETITFGKNMGNLSFYAFQDCGDYVENIVINYHGNGEGAVMGGDYKNIFGGWDAKGNFNARLSAEDMSAIKVYVPDDLVDKYKADSRWSSYNIQKLSDYKPSTNITPVGVSETNATPIARYTVDGRAISAPTKGVNIIRMSDGTARKVMVK
jgi:hypothetical protein